MPVAISGTLKPHPDCNTPSEFETHGPGVGAGLVAKAMVVVTFAVKPWPLTPTLAPIGPELAVRKINGVIAKLLRASTRPLLDFASTSYVPPGRVGTAKTQLMSPPLPSV